MANRKRNARALQSLCLIISCIAGSPAWPETVVAEPAVTQSAYDAQMDWQPCPPFLPHGCAMAVLHGDPSESNADVLFKVPAQSAIPLHWHNSPERMVLVAGRLQLTYEGQRTAVLEPGSYAYGPARRPHTGYCASSVPCVLFIAFEMPMDASCSADSSRGH
jgi:quercetin dioxygenase-like cupin family protein